MTTHLDEELLAQWALDDGSPDEAAADHLQRCTRCSESLAELRAVATQTSQLPRLEDPPPHVWHQIVAELDDRPATVRPLRQHRTRRFRGLAVAASIAAVLGIGAGVIGTLLITSDDNTPAPPAAVVRLEPLTGKSGEGSADLIQAAAGRQLKVAAAGLDAGQGFYEVWLINVDGKRMVSLGVLNPRTGGTFQIPGDVTAQGYRIIDVSLEPDDGNPEHSHDSIIRGTLPS
ncbi:anti-sigma factor [Kribbella sp. NPDC051952]|uniref:anti-sigma factor n=1 Tax=Kribbella sp. NPDC051952 TaxID=3154851 RepID=UPI00342EA7CD